MTTFSQLVDDMVRETRRPDMLGEIVSYANQTIREVHFDPKNNGAQFYRDNFTETLLQVNVERGFSWQIPDMGTFQSLQLCRYLQGCGVVDVPERIPSRALSQESVYCYRVGGTYVFSGYQGLYAQIALGFFEFPRRLIYYPAGSRPAEYAPDTGWEYVKTFQPTEELRIAAQIFTSNWLLLRWRDTIAEGIRAKVYKRVSDTDRARTSYSMFSSMAAQLMSSEVAILGGWS